MGKPSSSTRTIAQINSRISSGTARVLTLGELKQLAIQEDVDDIYNRVDVIATGTFEPMEASGAVLNIGHPDPPIKMRQAWLDGVPAYAGFGAVDLYLGASQASERSDSKRGGGHVIADLIAGHTVELVAIGQQTDCYPRERLDIAISKDSINQFYLFNPRNLYQNFIVGVNGGDRVLHTYLGPLQPHLGNAVYVSSGELSPLLNDPRLDAIGIGTRIWLGGGIGYISWEGTQHFPKQKRLPNNTPVGPAATLALIGDAKIMQARWVRGCYFEGYGPSLMVGIGIPLPVLNADIVRHAAVRDTELVAPVIDFAIPRRVRPTFGSVSYAQLKSGRITLNGRTVRTAPLSSQYLANEIAIALKQQIESGEFLLAEPVSPLPRDRDVVVQNEPQGRFL
ncbi:MAG: homocysteine biosynthesis protein [Cyanobacteria bacterium P01_D01_bin.123]